MAAAAWLGVKYLSVLYVVALGECSSCSVRPAPSCLANRLVLFSFCEMFRISVLIDASLR